MFLFSLFLLFLAYLSGSFGQYVLTQPLSVSVIREQNAQITCSGNNIGGKNVHWYQQKPGQAPVLIIYVNSNRPGGISDRFSGSNSGNTATLSIARAKAEDEANYYCQVWDGSTAWVFGGGTTLTVTDPNHPASPPNVHLFPPSSEEKESKNKATMVCLVDGFTPPDIKVTWEADGTAVSNGVETTKPTKLNDKYVVSSYLTVDPSDWESHQSYTCKVTHKGTNYVKSVSHSQCP